MELERIYIVGPLTTLLGLVACTQTGNVDERGASNQSVAGVAAPPGAESGGTSTPFGCTAAFDTTPQPDPVVVDGVLQTDAVHGGRLGPRTAFAACGVPYVAPSTIEEPNADFHYKTYRFKNWNASAACVAVDVIYFQCGGAMFPCPREITCEGDVASGICGGVGFRESAVYLSSFDPNDIRANLLAQGSWDAGPSIDHLEFSVPANQEFVVVVRTEERGNTVGNGLGYDPYFRLFAAGCGKNGGVGALDGGGGKTW